MSYSLHHRRLSSCLVAVLLVTAAVSAVGAVGLTTAWPPASEAAAASPPVVSEDANGTVSLDGLRTWTAPNSSNLSNLSDVRAAKASGNLTRSEILARNDTLVLELRASGLADEIAAEDGRNATARFFAFLNRSGVSLVVYDLPGPERVRTYLDVTDHSAVTVVPDPRNGSHYVVVETGEVNVTDDDGDELANDRDLTPHQVANVTIENSSALTADGRETVTTEFRVVGADASLDTPGESDRLYLAPRPNQTISGVTSLAPGHRVTVEVRGPDGEVRSERVRVRNATENAGRFAAAFDLRGVSAGSNVEVWVGHDGDSLLDPYPNDGIVSASVVALDATVNLTERGLTEQGVLVENAVLSHGGYLAVHRGSADGEVITRSQYLPPGEEFGQFVDFGPALESNATLVVVAHHRGPGGALGEPYTENGSVVADSIEFTVAATETATPTTRTTDETTVRPTVDTTTTRIFVDTTTTESEGSVPGFGVGTALVALLAIGLVARRRKQKEKRR